MQWCLPFILEGLSLCPLLAPTSGGSATPVWLDGSSVAVLLVWGGDVCFVEVNSVVSTLTVLLADVLCVNFCAGLVVGFVSVQFASSKGKKNKTKQNKITIIQHTIMILRLWHQVGENEYQKHIRNYLQINWLGLLLSVWWTYIPETAYTLTPEPPVTARTSRSPRARTLSPYLPY